MRALITLLCLLFVFGCGQKATEIIDGKEGQIRPINLQYMQDPKTGLCFGYMWDSTIHNAGPAIARVPCELVCTTGDKKDLPKCIK